MLLNTILCFYSQKNIIFAAKCLARNRLTTAYMRNIRFFLLMALCTIGLTTFAQRQFNIYIDLDVSPTIEADNQQFYDVCIGDTITFIATEEFINNDNEIQDDSIQNLNFYWMMTKKTKKESKKRKLKLPN